MACSVVFVIYAVVVSPKTQSLLDKGLGVIVSIPLVAWAIVTGRAEKIFTWKAMVLVGLLLIFLTLRSIRQILLAIYRKMLD
jgi:hypothetical protein